jgi:hypothetical protein
MWDTKEINGYTLVDKLSGYMAIMNMKQDILDGIKQRINHKIYICDLHIGYLE